MNRNLRRNKENKPYIDAILADYNNLTPQEAGEILDFAIENHKAYGSKIVVSIEIVLDIKKEYPEHAIEWIIESVRAGVAAQQNTIDSLIAEGVNPALVEDLVVVINKLSEHFNKDRAEAMNYILNAVNAKGELNPLDVMEIQHKLRNWKYEG